MACVFPELSWSCPVAVQFPADQHEMATSVALGLLRHWLARRPRWPGPRSSGRGQPGLRLRKHPRPRSPPPGNGQPHSAGPGALSVLEASSNANFSASFIAPYPPPRPPPHPPGPPTAFRLRTDTRPLWGKGHLEAPPRGHRGHRGPTEPFCEHASLSFVPNIWPAGPPQLLTHRLPGQLYAKIQNNDVGRAKGSSRISLGRIGHTGSPPTNPRPPPF